MNAGELCEAIQDFSDDPGAPVKVVFNGGQLEIDHVEVNLSTGELMIHLKI